MSIIFGKGDLLFEQRLLACGGFYTDKLDGLWGRNSREAAVDAQNSFDNYRLQYGSFDQRSEGNIVTLLPKMQIKARQILAIGNRNGFHIQILSGTRTYAEQDVLFGQRPKVTNARGGQSNHNFGIAVDVGLFSDKGKYLAGSTRAEEKAYTDLAKAVKAAVDGIEWGGDWKSFKDQPHYQLNVGGLLITQVRKLFEVGKLTRNVN